MTDTDPREEALQMTRIENAQTWTTRLARSAVWAVLALTPGCGSSSASITANSGGSAGAANATGGIANPGGSSSTGGVTTSGGAMVSFHEDVEPILQRSCQGCHVAGGIAPFPLLTYEDARDRAQLIAAVTAARIMPPWHAEETAECSPPFGFRDDSRLSDAEIATMATWVAQGALEGDPNRAPPPITTISGLPGVQLTLEPNAPYTLEPGGDKFRCFVLDPKLTEASYVNGVFVIPGNAEVVHHVLLFTDPTGASLSMADANGSYDCFGGARVTDSDLLTAWTPGGVPLEYPSNVAVPVSAGSLLVMQVHYHPHSALENAEDSTRVQLRFSKTPPEYDAVSRLIGNFKRTLATGDGLSPGPDDPASGAEFLIPANAAAHTETMLWTFRGAKQAVAPRLYGVGGHMHYVGVDEKITLQRGDGSNTCLLQIPHWDFDWQRRYDYDAALEQLPTIAPGDRLNIRCTYDNSLSNPKLTEALAEQGVTAPHDVELGESTLDEMCLASLTAIYPAGTAP
jgi:hypothetical protein